ncbi:MAG: hypothetical protein LUH05_03275 [Candidatus Gastranaerophilales bacterium]|nr:hypothetical protein [Candidatus Gastranaerophilales bacterium]
MTQDLEEALGNHYSLMAKEFQLAYVKLVYFHLKKKYKNALPDLLKEKSIKLTITTGLEALGRSSDLNKLVTFFDVTGKLAQSAQLLGAKTDKLIALVSASLNLDTTGMFYTEEEKQQMQQQAQQQAAEQNVMPNLINQAGGLLKQQMQNQTEQEGV